MPTYEYKCKDSQHKYLEVRGITEDQRVDTCQEPDCESPLVRVFTAPPINLNGAGFAASKNIV